MNGKATGRRQRTNDPLRFLVVEDQVLVRELLCRELRETYPGCTVTQAGSLEEIRSIEKQNPDFTLAVVDLELPDGSALEWVRQSMQARPGRPMVILSGLDEDYVLFRAMRSKVPGYVHKNDKPEVLRKAIAAVLDGEVFYSPSILQMCRKRQADPRFFNRLLTIREQEVLQVLGEGIADEDVAALLGISRFTAAAYRKQIMAKLGVHSQGELMRYAVSKGFSHLR
jgi:DNA-binding NarL/FixJ family response regulator